MDQKYNQILWSIKKLNIPDSEAFVDLNESVMLYEYDRTKTANSIGVEKLARKIDKKFIKLELGKDFTVK